VEDFPPEIAATEPEIAATEPASAAPSSRAVADVPAEGEANRIRAALEAHHWHHARAAAELGISRTTLWRKMRALGLT
jgi:transcriptional regulator of acetoin/glycerol metabolism